MAFSLGRLNLNAVAKGVNGLVFGSGEHTNGEEDSGVERLLERISDGRLVEDRRAAMAELRDVVSGNDAAQLALGAMGFPILLQVLREERDDLEMVRSTLEVLVNGLSLNPGSRPPEGNVVPGVMNSELLALEHNSVSLFLAILEEDDFYVRYHTVQLLTLLLSNSPHRVEEAIVSTEQGVVRLMDMLQEREVIRNEALLLLTNLTRTAKEVQKIAAFQGAFERIWAIVQEEGGTDGGIVVQDCLELLNNLIRCSPSNQVLLRETVGFSLIPSLLHLQPLPRPPSTDSRDSAAAVPVPRVPAQRMSRQKASNVLCALELVSLLLAPSPSASAAEGSSLEASKDSHLLTNQALLHKCGLLEPLLSLALNSAVSPTAVRTQALRALSSLTSLNAEARDSLGSATVTLPAAAIPTVTAPRSAASREYRLPAVESPGVPVQGPVTAPALTLLLLSALSAPTLGEWAAADACIAAFCKGNPEGQAMLASTLTPPPVSSSTEAIRPSVSMGSTSAAATSWSVWRNPNGQAVVRSSSSNDAAISSAFTSTFGSLLSQALLALPSSQSLERSCRAACALSHVLRDNPTCKQKLLSTPLELDPEPDPDPSARSLRPMLPPRPLLEPQLLLPCVMRLLSSACALLPSLASSSSPAPAGLAADWQYQHLLAPLLLRVLFLWLHHCPRAVSALLKSSPVHLPFLIDTIRSAASNSVLTPSADSQALTATAGLAAAVLGECLLFPHLPAGASPEDSATSSTAGSSETIPMLVLDSVTHRLGLTHLLAAWEDMRHSQLFASALAPHRTALPIPVTRASLATALPAAGDAPVPADKQRDGPAGSSAEGAAQSLFDEALCVLLADMEQKVRGKVTELFARPAVSSTGAALGSGDPGSSPGDQLERRVNEGWEQYALRLCQVARMQAKDIQLLGERNRSLAEDVVSQKGSLGPGQQAAASNASPADRSPAKGPSPSEAVAVSEVWAEAERLRAQVSELAKSKQWLETEVSRLRAESSRQEAELQSLSGAYNALEEANLLLEKKVEVLQGGQEAVLPKGEAEADEADELTELLVCLGEEEAKVQKLSARLEELGEDVDALLQQQEEADEEGEGGEEEDDWQEDFEEEDLINQ